MQPWRSLSLKKKLFIFKIHFYFYLAWVFATAHVG